MKRNTLTAWLLGIILIFSATSCFNGPIVKGSKNYITKKENLEHFNDISMSGSANIIYQQASSSRIEIYGSDNIVELLETKVNGKTLNIKFKKNVNIIDKGKLEIKVFSPDEKSVPVPDSMFYEFLPTDADDDFSKIVTIDQIETGKEYEVIVTNLSGFYRYRMRDAVKIAGKYKNLPILEFIGRIDQTVSIMGEKTTEVALRTAAEDTAKQLGFDMIDFTVYPDVEHVPPRYTYFMEIESLPEGMKAKEIRFFLERNLAKANPSMGDKVAKGICAPTKLNILEPETYSLYRDLMIMKGIAPAQLKPVHIIRNELQRKFFFSQTEYGVELVK